MGGLGAAGGVSAAITGGSRIASGAGSGAMLAGASAATGRTGPPVRLSDRSGFACEANAAVAITGAAVGCNDVDASDCGDSGWALGSASRQFAMSPASADCVAACGKGGAEANRG